MKDQEENRIQFSDDLNCDARVQCIICGYESNRSYHYRHLKNSHKEQDVLKGEGKSYIYIRKVFHKCKVCDDKIIFDRNTVYDHMRKHTDITYDTYRSTYLTNKTKVTKSAYNGSSGNKDEIGDLKEIRKVDDNNDIDGSFSSGGHKKPSIKKNKKESKKRKISDSETSFSSGDDKLLKKKTRKVTNKYTWTSDEDGNISDTSLSRVTRKHEYFKDAEELITNSVHKMCLAKCRVCNQILLLHQLQYHCYTVHDIEVDNEPEKKRFDIVRLTYHRCRLCWKVLLFSFRAIFLHLNSEHYLSLQVYKERYLGYNKQKYLYTKSSKSSTGDDTEDEDCDASHEADLKQVEQDQHDPSHNINQSQESLVSCSLRDFITPQSNDLFNGENSIRAKDVVNNNEKEVENDTITSVIKSGNSEITNTDEYKTTDVRYKCPIEGCEKITLRCHLEDGKAALHIVKDHNMRLCTFMRQGLKWEELQN